MTSIRHTLVSFCLAAAPVLAEGQSLSLTYDSALRLAQIEANVDASVMLISGPRLLPPLRINGAVVEVQPQVAVPLGDLSAGGVVEVAIPAEVDGMGLQAVGVELATFRLLTSNAVFFDLRDLIERSLTARLAWKPTGYDLTVDLIAPTSGYDLTVDGFDIVNLTTRVWLRLTMPAVGEIVLPVLTPHQVVASLPQGIGYRVEVHMAREVRGSPIVPAYKLVAVLDGLPHPND